MPGFEVLGGEEFEGALEIGARELGEAVGGVRDSAVCVDLEVVREAGAGGPEVPEARFQILTSRL